jgi:6-phosphogluconolactonase
MGAPGISLTLPALSSRREMLFAVADPDKRTILTRVFAGENLPVNRAYAAGETDGLVDGSARPEEAGGQ